MSSLTPSQPNSSTEELYDTPKAANYLDVRPSTMEIWRWRGIGPTYVKIGRLVRYRKVADLDVYIAQHVFSSTTESTARC